MPNGILLSLCLSVPRNKLQLCKNMSWLKQLYVHAEKPIFLMQVQNLQGDLQAVQEQHDGMTGLVHTLQAQNTALSGTVENLQEYQGRLTRRAQQLEDQNVTLGEEAVSLQERLDATVHQQYQVSIRPGLHPLHMCLAHTSVSSECLSARASAYLQACFGIWQSCHQSLLLIFHGAITCHKVLPVCLSVCLHMCHHQLCRRVVQEHCKKACSQGRSSCIQCIDAL